MNDEKTEKRKFSWKTSLKTMGIGAFTFFLVKGLVWLAVFLGLFKFAGC